MNWTILMLYITGAMMLGSSFVMIVAEKATLFNAIIEFLSS